MAKERLKSPRARLFIALELPDPLRAGLVAWAREELTDPALRVVAPESLHITLAFLGYRPEKEIERLGEIVRGIEAPTPTIELRNPVARPERRRPRLFALPAESAGAVELQAELEGKLVAARLYSSERRPFWPHVTVARVRPERRGSKRPMRVSNPLGKLPQALLQATKCVRLTLYRSKLQPQGAQYTPLAQVELSEDGRQ
jgi:RNA 2',3'-cyclic 3'-phosphodiesterase